MTRDPCTNCRGPRLPRPRSAGAKYCGYRDWCVRCYRRWLDNGKPLGGPPEVHQGQGGGRGSSQLDEYEFLRSWDYTRQQCAARLGVTKRTIGRYEAQLRERRETTITEEASAA